MLDVFILEPFGFQVKIVSNITSEHEKFMLEQGWNVNFAQVFDASTRAGAIITDETLLEIGRRSNKPWLTRILALRQKTRFNLVDS